MQRELEPKKSKVIGAGILAVAIMACVLLSRNDGDSPQPDEPTSAAAYVMAQEFVEDRLKSPGTAEFPWNPTSVTKLGWGHFRVTAYVDSQNAFGATLRTNWTAEVKTKDGDKWTLVDLSMNPR